MNALAASATAKAQATATDWRRLLKWPATILLALALLYLIFNIYAAGQPLWALGVFALAGLGFFVYLSNIAFAYRYLFPGLAAMTVFVAFPILYTAQTGFTNYSSAHLLGEDRARAYLLEQNLPVQSSVMDYTLHADGEQFRLILSPRGGGPSLVTPRLDLRSAPTSAIALQALDAAGFTPGAALALRDLIARRNALTQLRLKPPDNSVLSYAGVREFAKLNAIWSAGADGELVSAETGTRYRPNRTSGYFEDAAGDRLTPGFKVGVGFDNYTRMIADPDFRGPFFSIFLWTIAFSGLTVFFTLALGMPLAVLLNWEGLRFRTTYRTLLFLPYAVPAFISILVFKGLFNQNFGEINGILYGLFGIRPAWFADPLLAKAMILIVNSWLGYPYIMILCSGLIKAIPSDLYEASAIAGAGPLTNFFRITAPLIIKPLTPLLITVFAFNFNNFVVIALLTDGRPDFLSTKLPAGQTDILVSYTYRIAFQDSGQNFGVAAAISTVIFVMVALLSIANLKLAKVNSQNN
jgi:maltose/maltodextrin transport system permease protein